MQCWQAGWGKVLGVTLSAAMTSQVMEAGVEGVVGAQEWLTDRTEAGVGTGGKVSGRDR